MNVKFEQLRSPQIGELAIKGGVAVVPSGACEGHGRLKQDRWAGPEGQTRSTVEIVAEHVEFKPQIKKDGAEQDGEAAAAEAPAETAGGQAPEEAELKEAVSF